MSDTNLTQLIVNHLTRDELHNADFTDHGNEVFIQKDHAGVSVGGAGVDALDTTNITNSVVKLPQDINFEINSSGDLLLKTGSKFYVPNGSGTFDPVTMIVDAVLTQSWNTAEEVMVFYVRTSGTLTLRRAADCSSGATDSISGRFHFWYDTTNNLVRAVESDGTFRNETMSFPLALIKMVGDNTAHVSAVNKIFNGFGYIGATLYVVPGVRVLIPNGKNSDGSLKNISYQTSSVLTRTNTDVSSGEKEYLLLNLNNALHQANSWDISKTRPMFAENRNQYWYNPQTNRIFRYRSSSDNGFVNDRIVIGWFLLSGVNITDFDSKEVFNAVSLDDGEYMAHQAMPSDRYIGLTLGASGATYTAPADGYIVLIKEATSVGQYVEMWSGGSISTQAQASANGQYLYNYIPVSKGASYGVNYTADGSTIRFRFVYANGSK